MLTKYVEFRSPGQGRRGKALLASHTATCEYERCLMRGTLMTVETAIRAKLEAAFRPASLEIVNESHLHHGHHGSPGTAESHFRVNIVSESFAGKSRVERHRLVNEVLKDELAGPIHALAIKAEAP
jgi:BolA protein